MKFFEVPDFHFSPAWLDVSLQAARAVADAAKKHKPDYIALPGDFFDKLLYAGDKHGYEEAMQIIERWTTICPVVAIEGTPGHDGPGAYSTLERAGLILLRPGSVYGARTGIVVDITDGCPVGFTPGSVLFGVPELNKKNIQAKLSLSADEANAAAVDLFYQYVDSFVSPHCAAYPDAFHHMLFHGNMSDARKENQSDVIMKASDIVIHTERLVHSGLDRISLGHIHTPWESENIWAGYAGYTGIDSNPWGKRDFLPAFNMITTHPKVTTRIPYGTPERRKIFAPLESYDHDIAYWLESDDPASTCPTGHPWSRVTVEEKRTDTRRISHSEADKISTLVDLFKAIDPDVSESVLKKVADIQQTFPAAATEPRDIRLKSVEVAGAIFFKKSQGKDRIRINYAGLPAGLSVLLGDNGDGKSSLLSFSSPYPVVIGKDTKSGRQSAIKDFFNGKDSWIDKQLEYNGQDHHHRITIRGAHTQSAKVECFLDIDGQPALNSGSFDEMLEKCEELYGPLQDFLMTYFYVQPLQGGFSSSLMSAKMTEIRNLVQTIAGIDRNGEKEHALGMKSALDTKLTDQKAKAETAQQFLEDVGAIRAEGREIQSTLSAKQIEVQNITESGKLAKEWKASADAAVSEADKQRERHALAQEEHRKMSLRLDSLTKKEQALAKASESTGDEQATLDKICRMKELKAAKQEVDTANDRLKLEYDSLVADVSMKRSGLESAIKNAKAESESLTRSIAAADKPCEHCGKNGTDAQKTIDECCDKIKELMQQISSAEGELILIADPDVPVYVDFERQEELKTLSNELMFVDEESIKAKIESSKNAEAEIKAVRSQIDHAKSDLDSCVDPATITWDDTVYADANKAAAEYDRRTKEYREAAAEVARLEAQGQGVAERVKRAEEQKQKADDLAAAIPGIEAELEDWKYIAAMLQPAKIPALELDLVADTIDMFANQCLKHYEGNRYMVTTRTQEQGKKGAVDRFDIQILDKQTGFEDSFLRHSPGEKAFFNDAYVKALVRVRNNRNKITYCPVVLDEADAPVQPERLQEFYDMQVAEYGESSAIVVSHNPEAHNYIENHIHVKELME